MRTLVGEGGGIGDAPAPAGPSPTPSRSVIVRLAGATLEALPEGALWWPAERALIVADLHLEKSSSFARRGELLPPYDSAATLAALKTLVLRLDPAIVVALGDSFHDCDGPTRLSAPDRSLLAELQRGRHFIWIAGNHDPKPVGLEGEFRDTLTIGGLRLRHEPTPGSAPGEIAGHLHPAARILGRGGSVRRKCFAGDGQRMILPAFGSYAGGLNILAPPFRGLFGPGLTALLLSRGGIYPVRSAALVGG